MESGAVLLRRNAFGMFVLLFDTHSAGYHIFKLIGKRKTKSETSGSKTQKKNCAFI